jgi:predicted dehydrogenase
MTSPDPIRVLLLGTGFGASVHAPGFASNAAFRLVGVASARAENARRVAQQFAIPYATDDWKRAMDTVDADLVSIATPADLHYPMARAALERGRPVLCEKPFALNQAQAKDLAGLARARGVVNVVNHEFRHYPARAALTQWIEEGRLGRVEHLVARERIPGWARSPSRRMTWLTERQRGGGYLGALGSHHVDQLLLWGGPVRRVFCTMRTVAANAPDASPAHKAITADDCFTLLLEFRGGATGLVDLFGGSRVRGEGFEAYGSADAFWIRNGYHVGRPKDDGSLEEVPIPRDLLIEPTPEVSLLSPFRVKVELLRAAIQDGKPAAPDFAWGVEIQKVLDAARLSDQSGEWVAIGE